MAEITLPSGLSGEIRCLTGKELKLLSDQAAIKKGTVIDKILDACWLSTLDNGPYQLRDDKPVWSEVLTGDRSVALLRIRALTFGEDYSFSVPCQACDHKIHITLDLSADIKQKPLTDGDRAAFENGNKLAINFKGKRLVFRLPIGRDEQKAALGSVDGAVLAMLNSRVLEIEGVSDIEKLRFLEAASLGYIVELQEAMDEHNCGFESTLDGVECDSCAEVQDKVEIPFTQGFLMSGRAKKR